MNLEAHASETLFEKSRRITSSSFYHNGRRNLHLEK